MLTLDSITCVPTNLHSCTLPSLLSARTAVWSMPVVLTETENENDSANQNDAAKMMLQNDIAK